MHACFISHYTKPCGLTAVSNQWTGLTFGPQKAICNPMGQGLMDPILQVSYADPMRTLLAPLLVVSAGIPV